MQSEPCQPAYISIVAIGVLSQASSTMSGLIGFGDAILFYFLWRIVKAIAPSLLIVPGVDEAYEFHFVVVLLSVRSVIMFAMQVYLVWDSIQWGLLRTVAPVTAVFAWVGCFALDAYGAAWWLHPMLGCVFTVFAGAYFAIQLWKAAPRKKQISWVPHAHTAADVARLAAIKLADPDYMRLVHICLTVAAAFAGFFGGMISVGGPPVVTVALALDFPKEIVRGTFPVIFETLMAVRTCYQLLHGGYDVFAWRHVLATVAGGIVGMYVGEGLSHGIPQREYMRMVATMLLMAGLTLGNAPLLVLVGVTGALFVWIWWCARQDALQPASPIAKS